MSKNTNIIACGEKQDIGCPVILWDDDNGLSFYKRNNLYIRDLSLKELRKVVKCFVVHHSVTYTAKSMYNGLNARNLSCNFLIDDDVDENGFATIYQCADIKDACWSHGPMNKDGPGVEISYMPQAWEDRNLYSEYWQKKLGVQPHKIVPDTVHGHKFKVFAPTDAQVKSSIRLLWGFGKLFPGVKMQFPKDKNGKIIKTTAEDDNKLGLLAHFHVTRRKIDPMGYPFEYVENEIAKLNESSKPKFPLWPFKRLFRLIRK
jgi:hypothetical protein